MATAIAYQRWSTPEQESGDSKKRQNDLVEKYCEEKGLTLLDTRVDPGVSAFRDSNATKGKLKLLMSDIASGRLKTDYILIEAFDRMSRNTALQLLSSIVALGPTLVTLNDRQEYSNKSLRENPMTIMWAMVQMMRGQDESVTKSRRVKDAWRSKREDASTRTMTARGPAWLDPIMELQRDKAVCVGFTVNEEKAKVVQGIYKMSAQGKSLDGIAKALNDLGIKPITVSKKGSKFWYRQQVLRFLKSKSVIGTHEPSTADYEHDEDDNIRMIKTKLEDIPNYYPPIIDVELAEKVWSANKTRSSFKLTGRPSLLTSGITKCEKCGNTMTYNIKGKYRYIICSNRRTNGCSNKKLTPYGPIEGILLHELPEVLANHSPIEEDTNVTDLKQALDEKEAEIGRVVDAIRYRGFDGSMGTVLDSLEAQRKTMRAELDKTSPRASKSSLEDAIGNLISAIGNASSTGRQAEQIPQINVHMRSVFKSLVIDHENKVIRLTLADGSQTFIAID
jgi:DNA invertase Pin-like site-specific DNA recombinase